MKKKNGFTLAEVLVTLGIIGVVAALATPHLLDNSQKAKVVPTLRKFMSTMENANELILADNEEDVISRVASTEGKYISELKKHVRVESNPQAEDVYYFDGRYISNTSADTMLKFSKGDAMILAGYKFSLDPTKLRNSGSYKGRLATLVYDINGFENKPNRYGKDIFQFWMDDSGAIIPQGGSMEYAAYTDTQSEKAWSGTCDADKVVYGYNCAGSIADNNWKIIYKY